MQNLCETRRRFVARNAVLTALLLSSALPMAVHANPVIFNSSVVANDPKLDQALLAQLHKKQWDAARQSLKLVVDRLGHMMHLYLFAPSKLTLQVSRFPHPEIVSTMLRLRT